MERGGQQLLTAELLAFFDCSVATAHNVQHVVEAAKLAPITILCPKIAEHFYATSRETRESDERACEDLSNEVLLSAALQMLLHDLLCSFQKTMKHS